jgi:hypothetical protein
MAKKKLADVADEVVLADGTELTVSDADAGEIASVIADLEASDAKREAYAEQPAETTAEGVSAEIKGKKEKAPRAPRLSLVTHKASDIIASSGASIGGIVLTTGGERLEGEALTAIDRLDKKTREKAVNLVTSMASGKRPSVYTVQAIKALRSSGGTLSLKGLVDYYLTQCSYKPGTARRQASEMFALFPAFRIASKEAGKGTPLVLNEESIVLRYIETAPAAAPAATAAA